ncbi:MAG: hypothetical protein MUC36_18860 [Planctomycetes bacterium]|jgi:hypothetical protein|nr:hypothetical protein [Planctomycetota bacterium]
MSIVRRRIEQEVDIAGQPGVTVVDHGDVTDQQVADFVGGEQSEELENVAGQWQRIHGFRSD